MFLLKSPIRLLVARVGNCIVLRYRGGSPPFGVRQCRLRDRWCSFRAIGSAPQSSGVNPRATSDEIQSRDRNSSAGGSTAHSNVAGSSGSASASGVTPAAEPTQHRCVVDGCGRIFSSAIGLGVHQAHAHPIWCNEQINVERKRARWGEEESRLLAIAEADILFESPNAINLHKLLQPKFPKRTAEAIRKQRMKDSHRSMVQESLSVIRSNAESRHDIPLQVEETEPSDDGFVPLLEELVTIPNKGAPEILLLVEASEGGYLAEHELVNWLMSSTGCSFQRQQGQTVRNRSDVSTDTSRRGAYARLQKIWNKNIKSAAGIVLDPDSETSRSGPSADAMFSAWSEIFTKSSNREECAPPIRSNDLKGVWLPFTKADVIASELDYNTSPGIDGVTVKAWRRVPVVVRTAFFNLVRRVGGFPQELLVGRTIFIPKKDGLCEPTDFRPITVSSVVVRQFNRILAKRMTAAHTWDPRQRAFRPLDGCAENLTVLNTVLVTARRQLKELHVASVDIAKAFDNVEHSAILDVVKSHGAPAAFVNYLRMMYSNNATVLMYAGREHLCPVTRGVRQGDPLSSPLFNMVLEPAIQKLDPHIGFNITSEISINALLYADDTHLFASTTMGLQKNLDIYSSELKQVGLSLNPSKCAVLSLKPSGKQKKIKVLTVSQVTLDGQPLKQLGTIELWKYLGVQYMGARPLQGGGHFEVYLNRISRAPLKPHQRVKLLKDYLIPRFVHGLVLGRLDITALRNMDVSIRRLVRRWLHLPHDVPNAFFHAPVKQGGLGIMSMSSRIPLMKANRLKRLADSSCPLMQAVYQLEAAQQVLGRLQTLLREIAPDGLVSQETTYWASKLHASVDGVELVHVKDHVASYAVGLSGGVTGRDYIAYNHVRINCLPTLVRTSRGRDRDVDCRAGCRSTETAYHVIQVCGRTHAGRCLRHNKILDVLANSLKQRGMIIKKEPRLITITGENRCPDLIVVNGNKIVVVDVQVVSSKHLLEAHKHKIAKYQTIEGFDDTVRNFCNTTAARLEYVPLTISWRGVYCERSARELETVLGVSKRLLGSLGFMAVLGSYLNFKHFNKTTRRARRRLVA